MDSNIHSGNYIEVLILIKYYLPVLRYDKNQKEFLFINCTSTLIYENYSVNIIIIVDIRTCVYSIHLIDLFANRHPSCSCVGNVLSVVTLMLSNSCVIP